MPEIIKYVILKQKDAETQGIRTTDESATKQGQQKQQQQAYLFKLNLCQTVISPSGPSDLGD